MGAACTTSAQAKSSEWFGGVGMDMTVSIARSQSLRRLRRINRATNCQASMPLLPSMRSLINTGRQARMARSIVFLILLKTSSAAARSWSNCRRHSGPRQRIKFCCIRCLRTPRLPNEFDAQSTEFNRRFRSRFWRAATVAQANRIRIHCRVGNPSNRRRPARDRHQHFAERRTRPVFAFFGRTGSRQTCGLLHSAGGAGLCTQTYRKQRRRLVHSQANTRGPWRSDRYTWRLASRQRQADWANASTRR